MTRDVSRGLGADADRIPAQRHRSLTREEIMAAARELLTPHHSGELSLRAVARAVGIAPSGLYRYFDSREALVEALAADARESAQLAMREALAGAVVGTGEGEGGATEDHLEQALRLAHAYRRWCLEHRAEFSLLFAVEHEGSEDARDPRGAVHPFFAGPLQHYVLGIRIGAVDPDAAGLPVAPALSAEAEAMRAALTPELSPRDVGVLLWAWAALQGFLSLELLGPLGAFYADAEAAFDAHARAVYAAIGYRGA